MVFLADFSDFAVGDPGLRLWRIAGTLWEPQDVANSASLAGQGRDGVARRIYASSDCGSTLWDVPLVSRGWKLRGYACIGYPAGLQATEVTAPEGPLPGSTSAIGQ